MYYRKQKENKKLEKLSNDSTIYCRGAYFCEKKNRYIRLYPSKSVKYWKRHSNKHIRRYKLKSHKGNWYKRVFDLSYMLYWNVYYNQDFLIPNHMKKVWYYYIYNSIPYP